ncbi:MAG: site-specific DNA-methyltransferase [Pseudomonadota bacterium]
MTASQTFLDGRVTMHMGDVLARLADLPDDHFDCVVTSPPYWGLRDYGVDGQIGLERTLGEHLDVMAAVFDEVRRVLKPTGTLWLNYGDCYATQPNGRSAQDTKAAGTDDRTFRDKPFSTVGPIYGALSGAQEAANGSGCRGGGNNPSGPVYTQKYDMADRRGGGANKGHNRQTGHCGRIVAGGTLKPKDLCMIPNRLAIALQDAGWWVRSEIFWAKPNAMPDSSGLYRPATAHEKIFLLTKSVDAKGWWVARDTKEVSDSPDLGETCIGANGKERNRWTALGHYFDAESVRIPAQPSSLQRWSQDIDSQAGSTRANGGAKTNGTMKAVGGPISDKQRGHSRRHAGFNDRWDKAEQQSGGRYLRNYEPAPPAVWSMATASFSDAHFATFPPELVERCLDAGGPKGGRVLDPFGGAGTTALVALAKGMTCDLIELNPAYADIARKRIEEAWQGSVEATVAKLKTQPAPDAGPLFSGGAA